MKANTTGRSAKQLNGLRTWIDIDRKAVSKNIAIFRGLIGPQTKLMAVVKSNAYGHGLVDFSHEAEKAGVDFLAVDSLVEGLALRADGIKTPILVLGYTLPENLVLAAQANVSVSVSNREALEAFLRLDTKELPAFHLKVDTGMHRQGFQLHELSATVAELSKAKDRIKLEGVFTHFAAAKNPSFPQYTNRQLAEFLQWTDALSKAGFNPIRHAAATAGAILFPESHLDMVRVGIGLYGLWPSSEVRMFAQERLKLEPVLSWKAVIAEVKTVKKGERLGYDLTEVLLRDSRLAIIPIGYWHGYPRALSSIGHTLVGGKRARVLGRVAMDMLVIDVTDIPAAKAGDEAVLLGKEGKEEISADELGTLSGTVNYEIVTRINPLIKRIYR